MNKIWYSHTKRTLLTGETMKEAMELNVEKMQSLPLWVQFPKLELLYWGSESLSKIGSTIGIPIIADKYTRDKEYLHYARMLIEVALEGPFRQTIDQ